MVGVLMTTELYSSVDGGHIKVAFVGQSSTHGVPSAGAAKATAVATVTFAHLSSQASCSLKRQWSWRCVARVPVPAMWFAAGPQPLKQHLQVAAHVLTGGPRAVAPMELGNVRVHAKPRRESAPQQHLTMTLPHHTLYPGQTFEVPIHTTTVYELEVIQGKLQTPPGLNIIAITFNPAASPPWSKSGKIQVLADGSIAGLQAIRDGVQKQRTGLEPRLLCTVTLRVASNSDSDSNSLQNNYTIDVAIAHDQDAHGTKAVSSPTTRGAVMIDSRLSMAAGYRGHIFAARSSVVGVAVVAQAAQLVNTAVLDGVSIHTPFDVYTVSAQGNAPWDTFARVKPSSDLQCSSNSTRVLSVEPGCRHTTLHGTEVAGSVAAHITVVYKGIQAQQLFSVWFPVLPLNLRASNDKLHPVLGWRQPNPNFGCTRSRRPGFQTTPIYATATFMQAVTPGGAKFEADVQQVVRLLVGAKVTGLAPAVVDTASTSKYPGALAAVVGVSTGTALVEAQGPNNVTLGSTRITVSGDLVEVRNIFAVAVRKVGVSVHPGATNAAYAYAQGKVCVAREEPPVLSFEGDLARIITYAEFSDTTWMPLSDVDGLQLKSRANASVTINGADAIVPALGETYANGSEAALVHVIWHPQCSTVPLKETDAILTVNLPHAERIVVHLRSTTTDRGLGQGVAVLTHPNDAAAACVAVEAELVVTLVYPGGRQQPMGADPRTQISLQHDGNLTIHRVGGKILLRVGGGAMPLRSSVTVSFPHEAVTGQVPIEIAMFERFLVNAVPHPSFQGSETADASVLRLIQGTVPPAYEQAKLVCGMEFSNGGVCHSLPAAHFEIDSPSAPALIQGDVLRVSAASRFGVDCVLNTFRTAAADKLAIVAAECKPSDAKNDGCAHVSQISDFSLEQQGTNLGPKMALRGRQGQSTATSVVTVQLSDGRIYTEATPYSSWLAGVLAFSTANTTVLTINSSTGAAVLQATSSSPVMVTVHATVGNGTARTRTTQVTCNADAMDAGDFDLGNPEGLAGPLRKVGDRFQMGVRINTGGKSLGSFDFMIFFGAGVVALDGEASIGQKESALVMLRPKGATPCMATAVDVEGAGGLGVRIVGACTTQSNIKSPVQKEHNTRRASWDGIAFVAIKLKAVGPGASTITGQTDLLTDASNQQFIGVATSPGHAFVAGTFVQHVTGAAPSHSLGEGEQRRNRRGEPSAGRSAPVPSDITEIDVLPVSHVRYGKDSNSLFVPGDADLGQYPGSARGMITAQDVACVMNWIDNHLMCSNLGSRDNAAREGTDVLDFWDAACCYMGTGPCEDKFAFKYELERKTSNAYRAFGAGSNQWESFMDVDLDTKLTTADALHLLRAITGERVLIRAPGDYAAKANLLTVALPTNATACTMTVSSTIFVPAGTLPYCVAVGGPGCRRDIGVADGIQLLAVLLHPSLEFSDAFRASQLVTGSGSASKFGGILSLKPKQVTSVSVVVPHDSSAPHVAGAFVEFASVLFAGFGSAQFPGISVSLAVLVRAPAASQFKDESTLTFLPRITQPFSTLQPPTSEMLQFTSGAWAKESEAQVHSGINHATAHVLQQEATSSLVCFKKQPCAIGERDTAATLNSVAVCATTTTTTSTSTRTSTSTSTRTATSTSISTSTSTSNV